METKGKIKNKNSPVKLIILISVCFVVFVLFITMLTDYILVSLSVSPVFSKIMSVEYNGGEYTEGHGILYSTIETKSEFGNGYIAGYKFYFGNKKFDSQTAAEIPKKYHNSEDGTVMDLPFNSNNGGSSSSPAEKSKDDGNESIINEDDVLNMDSVRMLADGEITPFDFMKKYPGTIMGDGPYVYYLMLPNDYMVKIEYSGDTVNYMYLEDRRLNQRIDLKTQQIDIFLLERERQK